MMQDCHGHDVISLNEEVVSYGTPNAWMILGDPDASGCDEHGNPDGSPDGPDLPPSSPSYFEIAGNLGDIPFAGFFVASSLERVLHFVAGCMGVEDVCLLRAANLEGVVVDDLESYRLVSDAERGALLARC